MSGASFGVADTQAVLERFVLGDLLDDGILGARPGDSSFPLRALFGDLGSRLGEGDVFHALRASTSSFGARSRRKTRWRVGLEVSRLYYAFAADMDERARRETSPLLAALMTSELSRLAFESVDHVALFDSRFHERAEGADPHGARIRTPSTFLAKVTQNAMVRMKAKVVT